MSDTLVTSVSDMSSTKKEKLCLVCGDRALGYNFNAVSCESCKAFFRRNAHKTIRGRCEGKCNVNVESRSFCKRCRLAKCFTVGMRKDMILNEEQKKQRKQKILVNKLRRHGHMAQEDHYSPADPDIMTTTWNSGTCTPSDAMVKDEGDSTARSMQACNSPRENSPLVYPSWIDSQEQIMLAIEQLEEEHQKLVRELQYAMEESSFLAVTSTSVRSLPTNPTEFINIAEGFVRRVIKVAKNIASFKTLQKDDQISLLKGSVVDIMMLRSAVNYDPHSESWSLSTKDCIAKKHMVDSSTANYTNTSTTMASVSLPFSPDSVVKSPSAFCTGSPVSVTGSPPGLVVGSSFASESSSPEVGLSASVGSQGSSGKGDRISAELLKMGNPETRQLFLNYSKFIKSLMSSIHGDLLVLKILIMMSLFSADRSALLEREKVQSVQENYATVLQYYTGLRFTEDRTLFARLVMKLADLRDINEVHSKMLHKMKVEDIEPLLLEIFDL